MNRPYVRLPILFGTITAMILLMAAITLSFIERRMLALSGEALSLAAADIADKLDLVLYERAGDIQAMAKVSSSLLATREFNTLSNNLTAIQQAYPIYLWLGITDQNGRVVAATDNISVGKDRSQQSWFQQVHAQKGIYVEDPRFSEDAGGASTITFSAPIVGPQGEFLGVVSSRVGLAGLENLFARTVHLIQGEHRLTDSVEWELLARDGSVLSDSGQGGTMINLLNLAVPSAKLSLDPATRPGYVAELHDRRQVPVVTGYAHTNGYGQFVSPFLGVLVRKDRSDILSSIPTTIWQLGAAGAVVILPLWGLLFWTTRRLFRAHDDLELRVQERTTELSQSNATLLAQQNITLDGILIVDQQGKILSFNQQFMDLWSIPREVMESRSDERAIQCVLGKLQHPEEFVARVQYLYAHPAETLRDEIALCDGRTFDRYSASMKGSDGTYYGRIWYFRDITGRKRLEEKQAQLVAILESTPDFVAMADPDGHALYMNRAGRTLIGLEEEADISRLRIADKDQPLWPADYLQEGLSIAAREGRWSGETDMLTRDGRAIPMSQVVLAHKGPDGSVAFFSTIARDITERKQAQHKLEEQLRLKAFTAEVEAALARSTKIQEGLRTCAKSMVQYLGAAFARIWTLDPDQNVLCLQVSEGVYTNLQGSHARVPVGQYKIGLIAQEQQPHLTNQVIGDPRVHDQEWAKREGMVAFAGYPLVVEGRLLGVMALFARQALSENVLQALQTVAYGIAQFIERKQEEATVRASEAWFRSLIEHATDLILVLDADGTIRYASPSHRALGYASTDLIGKIIFSSMHPDDLPKVSKTLTHALQSPGTPRSVEVRIRTADGQWRIMDSIGQAVAAPSGKLQMVVNARDITDRKQKEEELVRSRETLRRIIDNIPQHVFWKDLNLNYLGCNAAFAQSAGVGVPAAIIGKTDFELSWGDKAEMYRADDRSVIESMTPKLNFEEPLPRPDGSVWIIRTNKVPLVDQEGTVFGVLGMFEDITERYRAEEQIRLVTSALEAAANGVVITDTEGTIQWVNPAFTALTGYCAEDVIGQNPRILKSNLQDQRFYQQLWDTITAGKSWYGEVVNKRKDGTLYTEEMSISPVRDLKGAINHFVAIKVDISQRKQMEAIAARLERQAAFGQLLGGIAHELKNPLFILTGHLQLLNTKLRQVKHTAAADLRKLEEVTRRITLITQRFLDLATPITMRQARCSIPGLLQSALDLLHNALSQGHVRVLTTWAPDLPDTWSDPGQVREVFLNLLLNAIQAMTAAHGRGTLTITAALVADVEHEEREDTASLPSPPLLVSDAERGWIEVTIQDDGPGIPPELRTKIFEPFFTTKPPENVTGLGLWIVRSNLMMLCGTIRVDSEVGHGTTFIVRLPVVAEPSTSVDPPAPGAGRG